MAPARNRLKSVMTTLGLVAIVAFIAMQPAAQAENLFAVTFGNQLLTIDSNTGAGALVGNLGATIGPFGLSSFAGKLYSFDQVGPPDGVVEIDPNTGAIVNKINIGVDEVGEGGIAFRSDGKGFLVASHGAAGEIYSFDLAPPANVHIGGLTVSLDGLDFDSSDVLYGLSQSTLELYTVNQTTGAEALVGDTGINDPQNPLAGLAFGNSGSLYAITASGNFYSVNKTTGAASFIGNTGFTAVSGLTALKGDNRVPEPTSIVLLLAGLAGTAVLRRRQR